MQFKKIAIAVLITLVGAVFAAGCGSPDGAEMGSGEPEEALVVIYGQHANSTADPALLEDRIRSIVSADGSLALIRLDGSPSLVREEDFQLKESIKNRKNRVAEATRITRSLVDDLSGDDTVAQSSEVDVMAAFAKASDYFGDRTDGAVRNVVVISDPGFSTTGVVNFVEIGLEPDVDDFVGWATEEGVLSDLSNIDEIVWYCFGDVSAPQQKPKPATIEAMKAFWTAVLQASGFSGELRFERSVSSFVPLSDSLPSVSVIEVPEVSPYAGQKVELREDGGVHFNPDEDTFIDESAAEKTLAEYVEWLEDPTLQVHVRGYVSHSTNTRHPEGELARLRAEAVKAKLVEMGVPGSQIIVDDSGDGRGPYEYGQDGKSDSEIDALNRFVLLSFEQVQ